MSLRPPPPPGQNAMPVDAPVPTTPDVRCPHCGRRASLAAGTSVYPMRPDLQQAMYWICWGCDAWAPCLPGTDEPDGVIANHDVRQLRGRARAAFEPLWRAKMQRDKCDEKEAIAAASAWLAGQLGLPELQFNAFDEATCRRALDIIARIPRKSPANEAPAHE